jgi:hypothetical protein
MNYKTSTIVLFLALIGMVIYHFSTVTNGIEEPEESKKETTNIEESLFFDSELAESFKKDSNRYKPNHGRIISASRAQNKLEEFLKTPNRPNISSPYGYSFGIDNFEKFANYVDSLKDNGTSRGKIIGVRVYRSISIDSATNKPYYDVFMIPVAEDGYDYPKIHDFKNNLLNGGGALNASVPCPDKCG